MKYLDAIMENVTIMCVASLTKYFDKYCSIIVSISLNFIWTQDLKNFKRPKPLNHRSINL